jgi:diaminopimelate epimerase
MTAFYKMQGLGNDFVVFDARNHGLALDEAAARAVADRRLGVGCDQVIVIEQPRAGGDAMMRIFNADGDEVEACGNGARCVARLLMEERDATTVRIDTLGGLLVCSDAGGGAVTADMGAPRLQWQDIPLAEPVDTRAFSLPLDGKPLTATAVSMGNPHCIIFVDDAERAPVADLGARIEKHPLFPERTNVEFVSVPAPGRLRMRVWERGAGVTRACGTGACAAAVAAHRREFGPRTCEVVLDGGVLSIDWREADDHVLMTGGASLAFTGHIDLKRLETRQ